MATILLSAAGFAAGSALGGSVLGLSTAIIGRAIGATLGRVIDQRLMGQGSEVVEQGRIDRFRLTGASEGAPISGVYGRVRVGGQVIWATQFKESVKTESSGGKGGGGGVETKTYSYSISVAVAVCEGEILRVGRVWADGSEIVTSDLNMRVYTGSNDQLPDPKIEAVEGTGNVPAYRGTAYVVFEDLPVADYGNRVPQFSFEVVRAADADLEPENARALSRVVKAVALMPGTGEYSLASTAVHYAQGQGENTTANVHTPSGLTDMSVSLDVLRDELPECGAASLIVSWFGDDLRAGHCTLRPKVEQAELDGEGMRWAVSGMTRATADIVGDIDDRPVYGGTPTDQSVIEAIHALQERGQAVMFYPFTLMEQMEGNSLPDPWSGGTGQAVLPWRGRITTSLAPGLAGSPDGTAAAEAEVAAFFGTAAVGDFAPGAGTVGYSGPAEWSYRRFILHYAHLCKLAGGVDAFCIGSEMRSLTAIRGAGNSFPAVAALRVLAADVRSILGLDTKISYAADWSEYFGYQPQDGSGDLFFHLDPLWADPNIDFIGIDNYMRLSDWRDGHEHADAEWGSIYNLEYLSGNVAGGEGYDWYYASEEARAAQLRSPIEDGAYEEPWVYRYKDLKNWWQNYHHERIGGVRQADQTVWEPGMKPFWFTELGCAAIDKGTNQPNKFLDPKSSESSLPVWSDGSRDDLIQAQYLRAVEMFYSDPENNPVSEEYGGRMVDMSRAFVWAWDARPFPYFPMLTDVWSDGANYTSGHWLNGRTSSQALAGVVAELCRKSGVTLFDVSKLYGLVRGYGIDDITSARSAMQPLMLAYGFEAIERDGVLQFQTRHAQADAAVDPALLAMTDELDGALETARAPAAEMAGRVRLTYVENDGDFEARATEAIFPDEATYSVSQSELPLVLTQSEAQSVVERWLTEARIARDSVRFALPPSSLALGAGDVVTLPSESGDVTYRIDRVEQGASQLIEAVRIDPDVTRASTAVGEAVQPRPFVAAVPVYPLFMDLPFMTGDEVEHAPHIAVTAKPWPGSVAVYSSTEDAGYDLNLALSARSTVGRTLGAMPRAAPGLWDRGPELRVKLVEGALSSASLAEVLNGANVMAIGDGSAGNWELFQFAEAELVDTQTYALRMRLRGQAGSDGIMPDQWPAGSEVVLMNGAPTQVELASSSRGLERYYRIGPSSRSYDDASYQMRVEAFDGIGLRPYAPAHLKARPVGGGDLALSWTRRTRIDGDSWVSLEVPLGEEQESYLLRVWLNGGLVREELLSAPAFDYTSALQTADGVSAPYVIEVAQISDRFGPGLFTRIEIND